jgi:hypothetical protein
VGIRYNCLYTEDPGLRAWLNGFDPDWENYQSECNAAPVITMLSPAGDILIDRTDYTRDVGISWDGTDPDSDAEVRLAYDVDNNYDNGYTTVDAMGYDEDGSSAWTPSPNWGFSGFPAGTYYILGIIRDEENESHAYAAGRVIVPPFEIDLIRPNGGEIYTAGSVHEIQWAANDYLDATMQYSIDNGVSWTTIASQQGPVVSYNWTVPGTPSLQCKVRLTDGNGKIWDESDSTFSIVAPVHTLYVRSTPVTGVLVTLSPEDTNGLAGGDTNFTRSYEAGTTVTLTAPQTHKGKTFLKWMVDGSHRAGRTVTVTMGRDHAARAVYRSQSSTHTHTLTVQSSPDTGAPIGVSPSDNNGLGDGAAEFSRTYDPETEVILTAPASHRGKAFVKWLVDGTETTGRTVGVVMDKNHTARAVYRSSTHTLDVQSSPSAGVGILVSPVDNNGDGDGITGFTRTYDAGTVVTLTAPSTAGGGDFVKWTVNGEDIIDRTIQPTIGSDFIVTAFYETPNPPEINVSRNHLNFGYITGGTAIPAGTFAISNSGGGTLDWGVAGDMPWVILTPVSGVNSGIVEVSIDPAGLAPGKYEATISVSAPSAINSPVDVRVKLRIKDKSEMSPPFGEFSTPRDGSVVSGCVPATGWALGDTGIENVKLYLEAGEELQYIGDAVFVEGSRRDVEAAYPDYPMNHKAGWGYMILTPLFPNGGNGVFKLHAVAEDGEGLTGTLGVKTVTVDNAGSVKPFGAMDTPTQGGSVSGGAFINWGWALTPRPNTIPTDGSTIHVFVDGIDLGHPVYNIYREDIAALFPGYSNSNGAAGYFTLDTTAYTNGVHTLYWTVEDDAGNTDGIGCRYFTVQNPAAGRAASSTRGRRTTDPAEVDYLGTVKIRKGYGQSTGHVEPETVYSNKNGIINIRINELERLEIHLDEPLNSCSGYSLAGVAGVMGDGVVPLPIGSTLDTDRGIFCWQPGTGFFGEYRFVLIRENKDGRVRRNIIVVEIEPKFPGKRGN